MSEGVEGKKKSKWPAGTIWQKHKRRNAKGDDEETRVPYIRVRYPGEDGKRKAVWRQVESPAHARQVLKQLKDELERHGEKVVEHARSTFNDFYKNYYKAAYMIEAQYVEGRKVAGRRSLKTVESHAAVLCEYFGRRALREITYGDVEKFKAWLLRQPTQFDVARHKRELLTDPDAELRSTRSLISAHRVLQLLRHILNVAVREGWAVKNPFHAGKSLISTADERKRRRVMSYEEEALLLGRCEGRREHLRLVVIALVDTAMRAGEAFKLKVSDLNFDPRDITIQEFNTKTLPERSAPITARLAREMRAWFERRELKPGDPVFHFASVKRSFAGACRAAGIEDLRIKDLRRTAATRLVRGGMPIEEVSRILGHTDIAMTFDYIGVDRKTTERAADILDEMLRRAEEEAEAKRRALAAPAAPGAGVTEEQGFVN